MYRREFLKAGLQAATIGAVVSASPSSATATAAEPRSVRDAMWIWAHPLGSYDNAWGLPGNSLLSPVEGAKSMGVPNIILVHYEGKPKPPFDDFAADFQNVNKVMWSVAGAGGVTSAAERDQVFALAERMPNISGVFLDDFFHFTRGDSTQASTAEPPASLSLEDLRQLRKRLTIGGRKLDLGVTLYTNQLDQRIVCHLEYCDIVSFWTWEANDLARLEENFAMFQTIAPGKRVLLGLYMWDFGKQKPMPLDLMKKQCDLALKWLREGRIEGMIFLATNICDLKIEAVDWARAWIAEVGDQPIGSPR
jgi:hypothetical protein